MTFLEEIIEDLPIQFTVGGNLAAIADITIGEIQKMNHPDHDLLRFDAMTLEPDILRVITDQPHKRLPVFAVVVDDARDELGYYLGVLRTRQLVEDRTCRMEQKDARIDMCPSADIIADIS